MTTPTTDVKVETPTEEKTVETPTTETPVSEASAEEQTVSTDSPETTETPEKAEKLSEAEALTEDEKKQLSVKAQKRIQSLANKAKSEKARADKLEKEAGTSSSTQEGEFTSGITPEPTADSPSPQVPPRLPWEGNLEEGEPTEVTREDYKRDVLTTADWLVKARIGQARRVDAKVNEIKSDLTAVQQKYEVLNPESEKYDKELSAKLAGLFGNQIKANPKARLAGFVETVMDVRQGGKDEGTAETSATLEDQKAEEALTPSEAGTSEVETPFEDLNLEEQEKYLKDNGLWE